MDNYAALVDVLIKEEMRGARSRHETIISLGDTPQCLVDFAGFSPIEIVMKGKTLSKICFDHGVKTSQIKRLPEIISNPKGLYRSANPNLTDSVVVLTFEQHLSVPLIVAIRKDQTVGRGRICNLISSAYGKEGENPEEKWKRNKLLIWEKLT